MGWLLVLRLNEYLLECVAVCVKSEVILAYMYHQLLGVMRNVVNDTGKKNDEKQIGEMEKDFTKMH